jgi:hypothetical protein
MSAFRDSRLALVVRYGPVLLDLFDFFDPIVRHLQE